VAIQKEVAREVKVSFSQALELIKSFSTLRPEFQAWVIEAVARYMVADKEAFRRFLFESISDLVP
jgi:hypothetical protein